MSLSSSLPPSPAPLRPPTHIPVSQLSHYPSVQSIISPVSPPPQNKCREQNKTNISSSDKALMRGGVGRRNNFLVLTLKAPQVRRGTAKAFFRRWWQNRRWLLLWWHGGNLNEVPLRLCLRVGGAWPLATNWMLSFGEITACPPYVEFGQPPFLRNVPISICA